MHSSFLFVPHTVSLLNSCHLEQVAGLSTIPDLIEFALVGASLSEPHIDEFAVNFPYICIVRRAVNHFLVVFCVFLRHALFQT